MILWLYSVRDLYFAPKPVSTVAHNEPQSARQQEVEQKPEVPEVEQEPVVPQTPSNHFDLLPQFPLCGVQCRRETVSGP